MYSYYNQSAASTVVSTEGLVWNGSSWGNVGSSTGSTLNSSSESATTASLVQLYSQYYHDYLALALQYEAAAAAPTNISSPSAEAWQQEEWLRCAKWYRYYADQSSRVSHHYFQYPNTQPTFELPPPPPKSEPQSSISNSVQDRPIVSISVGISNQQPSGQKAVVSSVPTTAANISSTTSANAASAASSSPDGLKRFFHNCLQTCTTEQEKEEVKAKLQQTISKALQEGTLHATNWDAMELIRPSYVTSESISVEVAVPAVSKPSASPLQAGAESSGKRVFQSIQHNDVVEPTSSFFPKNKRIRFQQSVKTNNLGNHVHAVDRSSSLTSFAESTTTRVTPPLEAKASPSESSNGPSSTSFSSSPHQRHDKRFPSKESYYGPPSRREQTDNSSNYSDYVRSSSGSSEEDFVPIPNVPRGKFKKMPPSRNNGFERSNTTLAKRANRFGKSDSTVGASSTAAAIVDSSNFDKYMGKGMIGGSNKKLDETDFEMMTVKGTCTRLEKEYLRLTAPPRAELVRPQFILEQHYDNLVSEWKRGKSRRRDYLWFCSQFKAMRQDCRVQRIQNAFCVRVYETHARIALESDDLNEFNQCQTQLMELYDLLLTSTSIPTSERDAVQEHRHEFLAYRFIYYVFLTGNHKGSSSSSDLMTLMLSLTPEERNDPAIAHAARVREAVASMDYHSFFRLGKNCPNLGAYLVNRIVPFIRFSALQRICKAYRPSVELSFVLSELGFCDPKEQADGKAWLESCGCILQGDMVLTKDSVVRESSLQVKHSLI